MQKKMESTEKAVPVHKISVRSLVEFILRSGDIDSRTGAGRADTEAMQMGSRLHRRIQKNMGIQYRAEVPLSGTFACDDFQICVEGRADGILTDAEGVLIDEIKGIMRPLALLEEPVPVHLAQAKCYAYLYGLEQGLPAEGDSQKKAAAEGGSVSCAGGSDGIQDTDGAARIRVRMSYGNLETEEMKYFLYSYTFAQLEEWFLGVLEEYKKWARFERQWKTVRNASIKKTVFPYVYREGQKELAGAVYRTIQRRKLLFIQAPTGTGKTLAVLFPAVKAVGEEQGERIFYLTARTIARTVAAQALDLLRAEGLRMKSVILTAKEKICPLEECLCDPDHCPRAKGHFDRINQALYELITQEDRFDRAGIQAAAERYRVCPFELSLDLSEWMDTVICDYNYVFDPRARLKRFFGEGMKSEAILLIDEAHNLVDRGREMYSAQLIKEDFLSVKRAVRGTHPKLGRALEKCNRLLLELKRELAGNTEETGGNPIEDSAGTQDRREKIHPRRGELWQVCTDLRTLPLALLNASGLIEEYLDDMSGEEAAEEVRDLYFQILAFLDTLDRLGEDYIPYSELLPDGKLMLRLYCVDPSRRLQECMDKVRSSILFSATLLPIDYYRSLLCTQEDPYAVYARSCFPKENLQILIGRDTSTRYTRRTEEEYQRIAKYICAGLQQKKGNYLAFFPSYRMLEDVQAVLEGILPAEYEMLCQHSGMDEESREVFLNAFSEQRPGGLIGLCVMGSIFGEGIDLKGDTLIGAFIVGPGLPMVCTQQEILRQYYDSRGKDGFRYAYMCPGMNRVMQAVGRVIRTESDRGIALLLDERFARSEYRCMFPREWENHGICSIKDAALRIRDFWSSSF